MLDFVKRFVPESMLESAVLKVAGKAAAAAAATIVTLMVSHGFQSADATNISEAVSALVMGLAMCVFHKWEGETHCAQITVAAAAGVSGGIAIAHARQEGADTQAQADQSVADAVHSAIQTADKARAPDKDAILASLKAGSF